MRTTGEIGDGNRGQPPIYEKRVNADVLTKRRLLQIVCLNLTLEGESLVFTVRKPFDLLANGGILKNGRGGGIRTRDLYTPSVAR